MNWYQPIWKSRDSKYLVINSFCQVTWAQKMAWSNPGMLHGHSKRFLFSKSTKCHSKVILVKNLIGISYFSSFPSCWFPFIFLCFRVLLAENQRIISGIVSFSSCSFDEVTIEPITKKLQTRWFQWRMLEYTI